MCYASLHMPSRDVTAKERLRFTTRRHHVVPVAVEPTAADKNKIVCIRKPTEIVISKFELRAVALKNFKDAHSIPFKKIVALHGKKHVVAQVNAYMQIIVKGISTPIYPAWLKSGLQFTIGYGVPKPKAKAKKITGNKGMAVIKAAIAEQDKLGKVKAPKAPTKTKIVKA